MLKKRCKLCPFVNVQVQRVSFFKKLNIHMLFNDIYIMTFLT